MPFPPHVTDVLAFSRGNVSPMLEMRMLGTREVKQLAWEHSSRTGHSVGSVHCVQSGWPPGRGSGILSEGVPRKGPHLLTGPEEEHKKLLFAGSSGSGRAARPSPPSRSPPRSFPEMALWPPPQSQPRGGSPLMGTPGILLRN